MYEREEKTNRRLAHRGARHRRFDFINARAQQAHEKPRRHTARRRHNESDEPLRPTR